MGKEVIQFLKMIGVKYEVHDFSCHPYYHDVI